MFSSKRGLHEIVSVNQISLSCALVLVHLCRIKHTIPDKVVAKWRLKEIIMSVVLLRADARLANRIANLLSYSTIAVCDSFGSCTEDMCAHQGQVTCVDQSTDVHCITVDQICDGTAQCPDASDEQYCIERSSSPGSC